MLQQCRRGPYLEQQRARPGLRVELFGDTVARPADLDGLLHRHALLRRGRGRLLRRLTRRTLGQVLLVALALRGDICSAASSASSVPAMQLFTSTRSVKGEQAVRHRGGAAGSLTRRDLQRSQTLTAVSSRPAKTTWKENEWLATAIESRRGAPACAPGSFPHCCAVSGTGGTQSGPGGCGCSTGPSQGRWFPAPAAAGARGGRWPEGTTGRTGNSWQRTVGGKRRQQAERQRGWHRRGLRLIFRRRIGAPLQAATRA